MTEPTGFSFLSYSRDRLDEAALLIAAQRDRGIPTWQDTNNLDYFHTATALRSVLEDQMAANAILWLTPEVADSLFIRQLEAPLILKRARNKDGFFLIAVAAGGLDYKEAAEVARSGFMIENLQEWNMCKFDADRIGAPEAAEVANRVLKKRLEAINNARPKDEPLQIDLYTRSQPAFRPGKSLVMDWTHRFDGLEAKPGAWNEYILPSLKDVANLIQSKAPERRIEAGGLCSIPAAVALGCVFIAPRDIRIAWRQKMLDGHYQLWSIDSQCQPSEFNVETIEKDIAANDLAVLVSVADDVEPAFRNSMLDLPNFRAIIKVSKPRAIKHSLATAGQAADVAHKVVLAMREARSVFQPIKCVHLFLAVPAGLAMMIGQLMNTFGLVQTYQHIPTDGCYNPAALLTAF